MSPRSAISVSPASLEEDLELQGLERCLWPSGVGVAAGDAQLRGKELREIASWSASKAGTGSPDGNTRGGGALNAGAQSSARGVRAARTMTLWRGDDACTVALAALLVDLAQSGRLEPLPAHCSSARSESAGSDQCLASAPAPRAAAPTRSILLVQV